MKVAEVLRRNLRRAMARADLRDAVRILEELKIDDGLSLETRAMELEFLTLARRSDAAEKLAAQLLELHPRSPRVHFLAGRLLLRLRRYPEAEERFRESLRLAESPATRLHLARALSWSGRLDAAEAELLAIAEERPESAMDLAFVYERRGDPGRALQVVERYLARLSARSGDVSRVRREVVRLRARGAEPEDLVREVEALEALGEEPAPDVAVAYVEALLALGRGDRAREVVAGCRERLGVPELTKLAWVCYRRQVFDVAYDLFLKTFRADPGRRADPKHLRALERSAKLHGRTAELVLEYGPFTGESPALFGRIKALASPRARRTGGRRGAS